MVKTGERGELPRREGNGAAGRNEPPTASRQPAAANGQSPPTLWGGRGDAKRLTGGEGGNYTKARFVVPKGTRRAANAAAAVPFTLCPVGV